jgi:hypothetical protein
MNVKNTLLSGIVVISSQLSQASQTDMILPLGELEKHGISPKLVQEEFYNLYQINLNWNEYLKVSKEDEGKNIRFETYDHFSTVVTIDCAHGVFNKDRSN